MGPRDPQPLAVPPSAREDFLSCKAINRVFSAAAANTLASVVVVVVVVVSSSSLFVVVVVEEEEEELLVGLFDKVEGTRMGGSADSFKNSFGSEPPLMEGKDLGE